MKEDCIFCKILKEELPSNKIYENKYFFSIYDIYPSLEGHALVISKEHIENNIGIPNNQGEFFLEAIKNTINILEKKFDAEGFNVIGNINPIAGQIIPHFHFHIIPRKKEDNAKLIYVDKDTGKSAELKDNTDKE